MSHKSKQTAARRTRPGASLPLGPIDPEALAARQGMVPVADPHQLAANFRPEDETADQFVEAVRRWRREGTLREKTP